MWKKPSDYPDGKYPTEAPPSSVPVVTRTVTPTRQLVAEATTFSAHCTQCGTGLEVKFTFCPGCGDRISSQTNDTRASACTCGRPYGPNDKHCGACGKLRG